MTRAARWGFVLLAIATGGLSAAPLLADGGGAPAEADAGTAATASSAAKGAPRAATADADAGADEDAGAKEAAGCVERIPNGASRPIVTESFPPRGTSGYAANLEVGITHGKGETVLPEGFSIAKGSAGAKMLEDAGFVIPEADAGSGPRITVTPSPNDALTKLVLPVVPLATKSGRNEMKLPPLPVTISRANGDIMTICTKEHTIRVEEPIAHEVDPKVRPNPPPRPQREEWVFLKQLLGALGAALVLSLLVAYFVRAWMKRPKKTAPAPRPLPWLDALAALDTIRRGTLLADHKNDEYFDRVSDTIRRYLGARYNFEALDNAWSGLETTTDEMKGLLKRVRPPIVQYDDIAAFLDEADLVKFARVFPKDEECLEALGRAVAIVKKTIPASYLRQQHEGAEPGRPPAEAHP